MRLLRWLVTAAVVAGCGSSSSDSGTGGTTDGADTGQDATGSLDITGGKEDTEDTSTPGTGEDTTSGDAVGEDTSGTDVMDEDVAQTDTMDPTDVTDDDAGVPDTTDPIDVGGPDIIGTDDTTDTADSADVTDPITACAVVGTIAAGATVSGDTTNSASLYDVEYGACPGKSSALGGFNPEDVWYFAAPEDGTYTFTLVAAFDSMFYILDNCDTSQCLGGEDVYGYNEAETIMVDLKKGDAAYLVVDGYFVDDFEGSGFTEVGTYDLTASAACTPSCTDKICGDNGCGGSCGSCGATAGCFDGQCAPFLTACTPVQAIECGATVTGLDNADASIASVAFASHTCDTGEHDYSEATEVVLSFTATEDTFASLDVASEGFFYVTVLGDDGPGCGLESTCLDHGYASGSEFVVKAGATVHLVFEERYDELHPFDVTLTCCAQQCDGKECGDDGCGGSCGSCDSGYCDESASMCVVLPTECTPGAALTCEQTVKAVTNGVLSASFAFEKYSCQSYSSDNYGASPELVYTFVSEKDQVVTVSTEGFDSADVTVLEDLGGGCADTGASCIGNDTSELSFNAKEGSTYYVIWDSYSTSTPVVAPFDFSVTCCTTTCVPGACGVSDGCGGICGCSADNKCSEGVCVAFETGDTCAQPIVVDTSTVPALIEGDTSSGGNTSSNPPDTCGLSFGQGEMSNDRFYSFTAPTGGTYRVAARFEYDGILVIASDCASLATTCVVGENIYGSASSPGVELFFLDLEAGQTLFFVIDGYSNFSNAAGKYSITVEPFTPVEGDLCSSPIVLDAGALPLAVLGDNSVDIDGDTFPDFTDQFTMCGSSTAGTGPDIVYSFTPAASGDYAVNLDFIKYETPSLLSIKSGCLVDNTDCIGGGDLTSDQGPYVVTLEGGTTYFIVVDSYTYEAGPFTLNIIAL